MLRHVFKNIIQKLAFIQVDQPEEHSLRPTTIYLYIYIYACVCVCVCVCVRARACVYLDLFMLYQSFDEYLSFYQNLYFISSPFIYLSIYLSIYLIIYIYLSIYLSTFFLLYVLHEIVHCYSTYFMGDSFFPYVLNRAILKMSSLKEFTYYGSTSFWVKHIRTVIH